MASGKFELEKFTGENDFNLWRIKIKALLVQQGVGAAIDQEALAAIDKTKVAEIQSKAHSALILSLGDEVLREVSEETTALAVWGKLESLYMKKSLANRLYLKKQLYTLHMDENKELRKHLDDFNKIILDLTVVGVKVEDEDQAIILLSSLPKVYEHFVDTMLYGKETLSMTEVKSALNSKDQQRRTNLKDNFGEGLNVRGRTHRRGSSKNRWKSRSKSTGPKARRCWKCKKEGHVRRNCPEKSRFDDKSDSGEASVASDGYDSADLLLVCSADTDFGSADGENESADTRYGSADTGNESADSEYESADTLHGLADVGYDLAEVLVVSTVEEEFDSAEVLISEGQSKNEWILDSGCSFHMTPNRDWFEEFSSARSGKVLLGDNKACTVQGIGSP
ncbi:E3 ubiquitin-protein ligase upl4 [Orobanche minor]